MAGSQLKRLKATLKAHGLTGQAQTSKGNKSKSKSKGKNGRGDGAKDGYDADAKRQLLSQIREQFNPFDIKASRKKWDAVGSGVGAGTGANDNRSSKVAVGKPGISKQIGEEQRMRSYNVRKMLKARKGAFIDKRFGERDKNLTEEEKMLERFTRERQNQSMSSNDSGRGRRRAHNLFNLDDDDDGNYGGMGLTHGGTLLDDLEDDDDGLQGMGALGPIKRPYSTIGTEGADEMGSLESSSMQYPQKKKTKAEVMKEIIAKSKFYKHERQKAQMKVEREVEGLDENFDDVMASLMTTQPPKEKLNGLEGEKKNEDDNKNKIDLEYDTKLQQLALEKRAVPTDRTKTEEELQKEADEKRLKLEKQRNDRMNGLIEGVDGEEHGVEDLDDNFWSDNEDEEGEMKSIADSDDDIVLDEETDGDHGDDKDARIDKNARLGSLSLSCPTTHDQLLDILKEYPLTDHPRIIRKIVTLYQPKLAEGNKERLGIFTKVVLRHILYLASQDHLLSESWFSDLENSLTKVLKALSEKFNEQIFEECRVIIDEIQTRFKESHFSDLSSYELIFFTVVGIIFSTSDQYHLIVTPSQLLLCEFLEQIRFTTYQRLAYGAVLANISLQYQRISKRFTPELVYFFEKALATLLGPNYSIKSEFMVDSIKLGLSPDLVFSDTDQDILQLHRIFGASSRDFNATDQKALLLNILFNVDEAVSKIWRDLPAYTEIVSPLKPLLQEYISRYPTLGRAEQLLEKITRLEKLHEHVPLALQKHKPVAIPSHAPRFEENYNPERKSYDPDVTRNEINKMKAQLKKERKFTMKEIRKDTRFEARQRIEEKKKEAAEYHSKMARIYNTITTEEGAEKNKYEREKRLRTGKK